MVADNSERGAKVRKAYDSLIQRLPSTYPHATLIVQSLAELHKAYCRGPEERDTSTTEPLAFCNGGTNTIHIPLELGAEPLQKILWYMLHEIGHLYALGRYGCRDQRWNSSDIAEKYADRFADRWTHRLEAEGFYTKIQ
jgi:hypothetical protein